MVLRLRYVAGVTPAKWLRTWAERRADLPIEAARVEEPDQLVDLLAGDADLAFVRLPVDGEGLHSIPLWEERAVVVLPKDHAFADAELVTMADLADEPAAPEQSEAAMTIELVAAGAGHAIVPQGVARLHHRRDVVAIPVTDAAPTRIALVWRVERDDADVQEFVGIVRGRTARSSRGADDEVGEAPPDAKGAKGARGANATSAKSAKSAKAKGTAAGRSTRRAASGRTGRAVRKRGGRGR
jgi:DNA-binding transcriptional LysR family regulator